MKKTIRLTESDLHRVIKESVKRILNESTSDNSERLNSICDYFMDHQGYLPASDCKFLMDIGVGDKEYQKLTGAPHIRENGRRWYESAFANYLKNVRGENPQDVDAFISLMPKWSERELDPDTWYGMHNPPCY